MHKNQLKLFKYTVMTYNPIDNNVLWIKKYYNIYNTFSELWSCIITESNAEVQFRGFEPQSGKTRNYELVLTALVSAFMQCFGERAKTVWLAGFELSF